MAAGVAGKYEYLRPGNKEVETLDLLEDGRAIFSAKGETGMERWQSSGTGRWRVDSGVVTITIDSLKKEMDFKIKTLVPGIESGTSVRDNVSFNITVPELVNATSFGTNKWRKRAA